MQRRPLHLITTNAITKDEARARLAALGTKTINATQLALEWGWARSTTRRFIAACRADGIIPPNAAGAGNTPKRKRKVTPINTAAPVTEARAATPEPHHGDVMVVTQEQQRDNRPPPCEPAPRKADETEITLERLWRRRDNPPPPPPVPVGNKTLALVLVTAAIMLGGVGLVLNITFAHSFGGTQWAAKILAVLGGVIDVMTIILPSVGSNLWEQKRYAAALGAWASWCGVLIMTLLAASGFAATNIGDHKQDRENVTLERDATTAKLAQLRRDRSIITEARSAAAIAAASQQERSRIPADNWKSSAGCTNVTTSAKVCASLNALREAKADAERRDRLDADIEAAETSLKALPAYVSADPGAEIFATWMTAASLGAVKVTPAAIEQVRIAGLTVVPGLGSGLLLMFARFTWRARRDEDVPPLV